MKYDYKIIDEKRCDCNIDDMLWIAHIGDFVNWNGEWVLFLNFYPEGIHKT